MTQLPPVNAESVRALIKEWMAGHGYGYKSDNSQSLSELLSEIEHQAKAWERRHCEFVAMAEKEERR